jgi:hypothetical protein
MSLSSTLPERALSVSMLILSLLRTIFWISGFTALPGILNRLSQPLEDGIYWAPQVVGGSGFIISGFFFMLETQKRWYLPAFDVLGWHIGLWNTIGGLGKSTLSALVDSHSKTTFPLRFHTLSRVWLRHRKLGPI